MSTIGRRPKIFLVIKRNRKKKILIHLLKKNSFLYRMLKVFDVQKEYLVIYFNLEFPQNRGVRRLARSCTVGIRVTF